jgi:hypothetical protein
MVSKRPIVRPWSAEDDAALQRLAAAGATLLRATAALNRRAAMIRKHARLLGLHFAGMREEKRRVRLLEASEAPDGRSSRF